MMTKPKYLPTPPPNLPQISLEAVKSWQASGIRVRLVRVKGGYIVSVS
jgi:hypothetical protein